MSDSAPTSFTSSTLSSREETAKNTGPCSPPRPLAESDLITIRVSGLRRKVRPAACGKEKVSRVIRLPSTTPVTELGAQLLVEQPGEIINSNYLSTGLLTTALHLDMKYCSKYCTWYAYGHEIQETWHDVFTTPVKVTDGSPCYDKSRGLKINQGQSIASFFAKVFPDPIEANIQRDISLNLSTPPSNEPSGCITVGRGANTDLLISFMRTVRVPEDQKDYDLPPGLGSFPLYDVQQFVDNLPPSMAAQGGLFLPMYRE
jgi:hypothetical protein